MLFVVKIKQKLLQNCPYKSTLLNVALDTIYFHCMSKNSWNTLQNIFFYEIKCVEQHEGE